MEATIHVEANDAQVVGSGHVRDVALCTLALFQHQHPPIPSPELFQCGPLGLKLLLVQGLLSTQPSLGTVSRRYSSAGSSAVCSQPWSFQGEIHYKLSSSSSSWMVCLRRLKIATAVSRSSFQNHSKPGFRKQVESGSEAGLVVLRHTGILDTDGRVLDAPWTKQQPPQQLVPHSSRQ